MDAKTAPSANTGSATNATQDIAGTGHTLPHTAQVVKARAADTANAVAGKAGDMATRATTRIRAGVHHTSGRMTDLMHRRSTGWAAIGAGFTAAIAVAAVAPHPHQAPQSGRASLAAGSHPHIPAGQAAVASRRSLGAFPARRNPAST